MTTSASGVGRQVRRTASPSPAKPLGVAVCGASGRSSLILSYLQRNPRKAFLAGVYDPIQERAALALEEFGQGTEAKRYGSMDEMLSDRRAGAVFVTSTDCAHAAGAVPSLESGRHVFCEKPLATTIPDCDAIARAASKAKGILYLGMNLRHSPMHRTVHELVAQGAVGKPLLIEANEYYVGGKTYFRRWNRLNRYGGGLWITKATHDFDILNWLAGGTPLRVAAFSAVSHYKPRKDAAASCRDCPLRDTCPDVYDLDGPMTYGRKLALITEEKTGVRRDLCLFNADKDTFDNGQALVEYDSDVRACYTVNVVASKSTREIKVSGTEGLIEADMEQGSVRLIERHSGKRVTHDVRPLMNSGHGGSDDHLLNDFFDCCATGRAPLTSGAAGRASVLVGLGARRACDTKKTVELAALDRALSAKRGKA